MKNLSQENAPIYEALEPFTNSVYKDELEILIVDDGQIGRAHV